MMLLVRGVEGRGCRKALNKRLLRVRFDSRYMGHVTVTRYILHLLHILHIRVHFSKAEFWKRDRVTMFCNLTFYFTLCLTYLLRTYHCHYHFQASSAGPISGVF